MTDEPRPQPPVTDGAPRQHAPWAPYLVALSVMVVWGGTPMFSKIAAAQIEPLLVGILRTVFAGVVAVPILLFRRTGLPSDTRGRGLLAYSGTAAFILFPLVFTVGQAMTSATHGALILATMPVFTSLFGTVLERRRPSPLWVAGCLLALAGEAAVIIVRTSASTGGSSLSGDGIVLVSAVIAASGYVAGARLTQRGYPSLPTTLWGVALSAVVLLPLLGWSVATGGWPQAGPDAWISIGILAVLTSIVGYVAWYWALGKGGISRIAGVQFSQPLFGLALAAVVLGERPGPVTLVAGAAILGGAWMVGRASSSPVTLTA